MADSVRFFMERMVPELEALEKEGYFSRSELKEITSKRTNYEYALKRKSAVLADYFQYAEFEQQLESLRTIRKRTREIVSEKRSLCDYCIPRRVHTIYERATRKFKAQLPVWSTWLQYCRKTGSKKRFSQVVTSALKLHPCEPSLWITAASWEFDVQNSPKAARALMQRGLRMCPESAVLWTEYLHMELLYAAKLRARKQVLRKIGVGVSVNKDEKPEDDAEDAIANGAIAKLVIQRVIEEHGANYELRASLLELMWKRRCAVVQAKGCFKAQDNHFYRWSWTAELQQLLVSSIQRDFSGSPKAALLLAKRVVQQRQGTGSEAMQDDEQLTQYVAATRQELDAALGAHPSQDLYSAAVQLGLDTLARCVTSDAAVSNSEKSGSQNVDARDWIEWTLRLCQQADAQGVCGDEVYSAWNELCRAAGHVQQRWAVAEKWRRHSPACPAACAALIELWAEAQADGAAACQIAHPLHFVDGELARSAVLWTQLLQLAAAQLLPLKLLQRKVLSLLAGHPAGPLQGGFGDVVIQAADLSLSVRGPVATHAFLSSCLRLPPASCDALLHVAQLYDQNTELAAAATAACQQGDSDDAEEEEDEEFALETALGSATAPSREGKGPSDRFGQQFTAALQQWQLRGQRLGKSTDAVVRSILEKAVDVYGKEDVRVWLRYIEWSRQQGQGSHVLYRRGLKVLRQPALLVEAVTHGASEQDQ